jgi:phage-related protein
MRRKNGCEVRSLATTLEELQVLITAQTSDLNKEMEKVKKELNSVNQSVSKTTDSIKKSMRSLVTVVGATLAGLGIANYVKNGMKAVSDLEGALLGLKSIIEGQGRSFAKAKGFIQDYIADGLIPMGDAVNAYKNLASRGYNDEQIKQVMDRLKDAAAFGRQSSYTLGQAVASAAEGLKNENSILVDNAGVTKNVAKMWEEYAKSIGKTANNLTQQEKIQAEVNGIMTETQFQVGDAAKYTETYAGRVAALNKTLSDIQGNIGAAFMPIANIVLPLLQRLANWLAKVSAYIKYFMQAFFGVSAVKSQVNTALGGATQAQESYGNAAEKAGSKVKKAVKEAKGALAGFDEINSLSQSAAGADNAAGGSPSLDGVGGLADSGLNMEDTFPEIDTETIPKQIQKMADKVKHSLKDMWTGAQEFGGKFKEAFNDVGPALQPIFDAVEPIKTAFGEIGKTAEEMYLNFLKPAGIYILTDFIPSIVAGITETLAPVFADVAVWSVELLGKTFQNVSDKVTGLWNGTWQPALEKFKTGFLEAFGIAGGALQTLLDGTIKPFVDYILNKFILPISEKINQVLVPIFTEILVWAFRESAKWFKWAADLMNDIYKTVIEPVFNLVKKIVMDTLEIVMKLWNKHGTNLLNNLSELMDGLRGTFQLLWDKVLKPIIQPFLEMLSWLWTKHLKGLLEEIGAFVFKVINAALEIYNYFIKPLIDGVIVLLGPAFTVAFNAIVSVIGTSIAFISDILKGFFKILGGVIDFVTGVFTGNWEKAWEGVIDIFKGVFDSLWGIIKFPLNLIIDGVNTVIDGLNKLSIPKINIPGIGEIGGWGINIPKIPKLARGGIVDGATFMGNYIAGEAGPEMVVPLENTSFVDKLASALGSAVLTALQFNFNNNNSKDTKEMSFVLDGTVFARLFAPYLNQEMHRIGGTMIKTT